MTEHMTEQECLTRLSEYWASILRYNIEKLIKEPIIELQITPFYDDVEPYFTLETSTTVKFTKIVKVPKKVVYSHDTYKLNKILEFASKHIANMINRSDITEDEFMIDGIKYRKVDERV